MKGPQENGARIWLGASGHEVFGGFRGFRVQLFSDFQFV